MGKRRERLTEALQGPPEGSGRQGNEIDVDAAASAYQGRGGAAHEGPDTREEALGAAPARRRSERCRRGGGRTAPARRRSEQRSHARQRVASVPFHESGGDFSGPRVSTCIGPRSSATLAQPNAIFG
ncbi:unnamed protein product [Miscanthus lutarioriparius]|uniref:Uncharacterized protein n=1 Tax=Miscanthus lutarioriparius TaxID=422564 RepID=A0A811RIE0_9POAL|nr:unnamed protein product [Miscanthus lutarioriparius]